MGGKPKIVAKRYPSVSNSTWKAFFRWTWTFIFTTWKLGFLNISEYLTRSGIQIDPLITERRWQSGKKHVLCKLGLLSTIIRGRERSDQERGSHEKIALAHEHNWALIMSTSAREVARTSARRLGHPARAVIFLDFFSLPPTPRQNDWCQIWHSVCSGVQVLCQVYMNTAARGAQRQRALARRRHAPTGLGQSHEDGANRGVLSYEACHKQNESCQRMSHVARKRSHIKHRINHVSTVNGYIYDSIDRGVCCRMCCSACCSVS